MKFVYVGLSVVLVLAAMGFTMFAQNCVSCTQATPVWMSNPVPCPAGFQQRSVTDASSCSVGTNTCTVSQPGTFSAGRCNSSGTVDACMRFEISTQVLETTLANQLFQFNPVNVGCPGSVSIIVHFRDGWITGQTPQCYNTGTSDNDMWVGAWNCN